MSEEVPVKKKRFRSPPYPSFDLGRAVERVTALEKSAQLHEVGASVLSEAWGMKSSDGQVWRSAAALIQYGLISDSGTGKSRKFRITDSARRIVLDPDPNSEKRRQAIEAAALSPMIHKVLWDRYRSASDTVMKAYLTLDRHDEGETPYSDAAADEVIATYRKSLEFAGLTNASSIHSDNEEPSHTADQGPNAPPAEDAVTNPASSTAPKPPITVRVGDFVQWKSQGMLQFERPKRVRWVSEDGTHLAVDGSNTGIAVNQVSVELAPAATETAPIQQLTTETQGSNEPMSLGKTGIPTISMSDEGLVIGAGVINSQSQFEQLMKRLQAGKVLLDSE